ncbi:epidermal growth factor receptor kinase substrate 8-like protein 3 [Scleropages formosus]|uniref:epidermal growth factor receptor kinase substrate 8-like protein 3 n=1 Tax=Scleropages formosus TaxID=113540 RepID=UPI000878FBA6|nr:epidermal growth factor receptor kinase substrate 8-like protein 3 [Scleropages formosus]
MYRNSNHNDYDTSSFDSSLQSSSIFLEEPLSQRSSLSRPSGKLIYNQRKEFAESLQRRPHSFQHRVEHLLTCELDGRDMRSLEDCVTHLQLLDAKGQIWGQDVFLQVQNNILQMTDIETKEELESLALESVTDMRAMLGRCVYNSLLMIAVQPCHKRVSSVFLFHCAEVGAEYICMDLERAVQHRKEDGHSGKQNWPAETRQIHGYRKDSDTASAPPSSRTDQLQHKEVVAPQPVQYTETEVDVEIFNHLLNDIEVFVDRVRKVLPKESNKKNIVKNMMKMNKKSKAVKGLPPQEEYVSCLQKVKYGFNLLGKLNGEIHNPSAPDFVHCLFSILSFLVPNYPVEVPPTVISPLLTKQTIRLLSEEASTEEDQLWQSLGDPWNIPSVMWPDDEPVPPYIPEFNDGWQPPEPVKEDQCKPSRKELRPKNEQKSGSRSSPPTRFGGAAPLYMRVTYDFISRNQQELSVLKGDVVQVLDQSKQWWKVCNDRNLEGYVPNNVLESMEADSAQEEPKERHSIAALNKRSKPEEVKAWLEEKGFSPVTVRCLGVLSGSLLLGMSREELKAVCPEEGGRVFTQLQAVRTALA